jgi:hypothetical protein
MIEQTALASLLAGRLETWDKARKGQEQTLLDCYQDVMRIPRDGDTAGTGTSKTRKTQSLFMGSTRNKVRSARAKINDALFGNGEMPFDTTPAREDLAPFADVMEEILTDQMERMDFRTLLKTGVDTLATYGTGFIFGPFVRKEKHVETSAEGGSIKESTYEYDCPYFELANTLDVFPDPEARRIEDGLGVFWVTLTSPHTIKGWKDEPGYKNIDSALLAPDDNSAEGSARSEQLRGNVEYWHKGERIKVARYFGKVPKHSLTQWNAQDDVHDTSKDPKDGELIDAIVIMAGGVVIKVDEKPYAENYCPALRCVYEEVPHEIWGVGVAENNAPHQKVTNAAFRLFMEGKGLALLGTSTVDRSMFLPTEDFKKFPGKVYQTKPGLSPEQRKNAIQFNVEPDVTGGWLDVIRVSENFSDDDTGINKYTQGDDSKNLNKTAHGISMIMSAGSLPFKDVISNIDGAWVVSMVKSLIEWNLKYLEVETVLKIHGEKQAQLWQGIKDFGKSSFMEWKATGTASFMQKEVLVGKIRAFSEFALGNPVTAPLIDARELLTQTWTAMEVGKESPVLQEEGGQKVPPQVQQKMQQMDQAGQVLHKQVQQLQQQIQEMTVEKKAGIAAIQMKEQGSASREQIKGATAKAIEQMRLAAESAAATAAERFEAALQAQKDAAAHDREELKGFVQVLIQKMQPPPALNPVADNK